MQALGIDIGGTGIKGAIVDLDTGEFLVDRLRIETPHRSTPDAVSAVVAQISGHFDWKGPVGCTFPGVVSSGVIRTAANVDESTRQEALEDFSFVWSLAHDVGIALFRVHVTFAARDIDVAAQDDAHAAGVRFTDEGLHLTQKFHLRGKIFAAVRHIDRDEEKIAYLRRHNTSFDVESGMAKLRLVGKCVAPDVESHARVSARAVPITAISLQLAKRRRHLSHGRFELLQADHIRPLALDPVKNLSLTRTDPVDVPSGDFQHLAKL